MGHRAGLLLAAFVGACVPGGLDGLSGVRPAIEPAPLTKEVDDESLIAPRPVSPISVSYVGTLRPKLKWALPPGESGAIVEMCRQRACEPKPEKSFPVTGTELVVPDDLAAGVWFWRLRGRAPGKVGLWPSVTWELVLRGPSANGSSTTPFGGMVDFNGDGLPELVTGVYWDGEADIELYSSWVDPNQPYDGPVGYTRPRGGDVTFGGGLDINGDGFSDIFQGGLSFSDGGRVPMVDIVVGRKAYDGREVEDAWIEALPSDDAGPSVAAAGDLDGDGYGDILVGKDMRGFVARGVVKGPLPVAPVPMVRPGAKPLLYGGFDANDDGLADFVYAAADALGVATGNPKALWDSESSSPPLLTPASAMAAASGDFDGDGRPDVAVTIAQGTRKICFWFGAPAALRAGPCMTPPQGIEDFGSSITAAAVDENGHDQLLVSYKMGTRTGVYVMTPERIEPAELAVGYGVALTTIWMGRPGLARWATMSPNRKSIAIFDGRKLREVVAADDDETYALALR
jgi:hypothetical protein